jgi:hypothetical protein
MGAMLRLHNGFDAQCRHAASAWLKVTKISYFSSASPDFRAFGKTALALCDKAHNLC